MTWITGVETIKRQIRAACVCLGARCQSPVCAELSLRPIGCMPALWRTAPLQLQLPFCGAI